MDIAYGKLKEFPEISLKIIFLDFNHIFPDAFYIQWG